MAVMRNALPSGDRAKKENVSPAYPKQSLAVDVAKAASGDGKLYFCVIDRLSYGSLETALVHVRM
jgi:hypothetical protein